MADEILKKIDSEPRMDLSEARFPQVPSPWMISFTLKAEPMNYSEAETEALRIALRADRELLTQLGDLIAKQRARLVNLTGKAHRGEIEFNPEAPKPDALELIAIIVGKDETKAVYRDIVKHHSEAIQLHKLFALASEVRFSSRHEVADDSKRIEVNRRLQELEQYIPMLSEIASPMGETIGKMFAKELAALRNSVDETATQVATLASRSEEATQHVAALVAKIAEADSRDIIKGEGARLISTYRTEFASCVEAEKQCRDLLSQLSIGVGDCKATLRASRGWDGTCSDQVGLAAYKVLDAVLDQTKKLARTRHHSFSDLQGVKSELFDTLEEIQNLDGTLKMWSTRLLDGGVNLLAYQRYFPRPDAHQFKSGEEFDPNKYPYYRFATAVRDLAYALDEVGVGRLNFDRSRKPNWLALRLAQANKRVLGKSHTPFTGEAGV